MAIWTGSIKRDEKSIVDPLAVIEDLETRRQPRALRDWILTGDMGRLKQLDDDIAWLRELAAKRAKAG